MPCSCTPHGRAAQCSVCHARNTSASHRYCAHGYQGTWSGVNSWPLALEMAASCSASMLDIMLCIIFTACIPPVAT